MGNSMSITLRKLDGKLDVQFCMFMHEQVVNIPNSILSGTDARCISRNDNSHIGCTYVILITPIPSSSSYHFQRPA